MDNFEAFDRHNADMGRKEKKWIKSLPICPWCNEPIRSDNCYIIGDDVICEDCIEGVRDYTENHMRG